MQVCVYWAHLCVLMPHFMWYKLCLQLFIQPWRKRYQGSSKEVLQVHDNKLCVVISAVTLCKSFVVHVPEVFRLLL